MKKLLNILFIASLTVLPACNETFSETSGGNGRLSFENFRIESGLEVEVTTKAVTEAGGDYLIEILSKNSETVFAGTYSEVKATGYGVELPAGDYSLKVQSAAQIPFSGFDSPVYGTSESFSIFAGQTTKISKVTCKILQCAATVDYDPELVEIMTGDGETTVEVSAGYPLSYKLDYNGGSVKYEDRIGYFSVPSEPCTMIVTFVGYINGSRQKMTKQISGVKIGELREITFIKKVEEEGNVTFDIVVNGYVQDEELDGNAEATAAEVIGDDPDAPKGDGGIKLEFAPDCTQFADLENIVVPAAGTPMDLRLIATIPNGVKKFLVKIESTNAAFASAVVAAGGPVLDLVNPSPESEVIFQVVPFPHGSELVGQTSVNFNLSAAQEPILAFEGEHKFVMQVTDTQSCKKDIVVKMIVK